MFDTTFCQREINKKFAEYYDEVEQGPLFKDVAADWKEEHYKTLSPTTAHGYEASYKRATKQFGETHIKDIKPADIATYLQSMGNKQLSG